RILAGSIGTDSARSGGRRVRSKRTIYPHGAGHDHPPYRPSRRHRHPTPLSERMKPVIDIRRIGPDAYAWRIRTDSVEVQEGSGFASMAQCLRHAGAALDADCARFDISFEGMF